MRLAENESRQVGMKFEALVELSRTAEGLILQGKLWGIKPVIAEFYVIIEPRKSNAIWRHKMATIPLTAFN
jgi:hypothetical protein